MSLRSKVIGTLLGVFVLYALVAWLSLVIVYTAAFDRLERDNASNQLTRISKYIEAERADVDLLVNDWANWTETFNFALGKNDDHADEHLVESYLAELGMSFGAVIDMQGRVVWGEVYPAGEDVAALDYLFPDGTQQGSVLLSPVESGALASGLINTALGPVIVSSSAIFRSSGRGFVAGHLIVGKLLDTERMENISNTMLTPIGILSVEPSALPLQFYPALGELLSGNEDYAIAKQGDAIHALSLLRDIDGLPMGILQVVIPADISTLGTHTLHTTISTLVIAALILTLTLWITLKGMLLVPIEQLTQVLKGRDTDYSDDKCGKYLLSTVQRLVDSRGLISNRNDEIGQLIGAFDDLSASLREATNSVWRVAHLDGLTGLANRRLFMERLSHDIESAGEGTRKLTVLFVDLDNFKAVNDQHGHEIGDQLLVEVAKRLLTVVGEGSRVIGPEHDGKHNFVARIGGDEFVILLPTDERTEYVNNIASSIVDSIGSPFHIEGLPCQVGACVGMAVYPDDATDISGVLSKADSAMYEAKRAGKSCWRRFVPGLSRLDKKKSA